MKEGSYLKPGRSCRRPGPQQSSCCWTIYRQSVPDFSQRRGKELSNIEKKFAETGIEEDEIRLRQLSHAQSGDIRKFASEQSRHNEGQIE